jgi:hypothetical protein
MRFLKESIHVPPKKKSTLYLYSKCAFCSETEARLIFCTGGPSLGAKFSQKMFPRTPTGNGHVGLGPRDLSEFGFKVDENSPPPKKIAGEILAKK